MRRLWDWGRLLQRRKAEEVSGQEVAELLATGNELQIVDIRGESAFRAGHLPGALHVPLQSLEQMLPTLDPSRPTVVY